MQLLDHTIAHIDLSLNCAQAAPAKAGISSVQLAVISEKTATARDGSETAIGIPHLAQRRAEPAPAANSTEQAANTVRELGAPTSVTSQNKSIKDMTDAIAPVITKMDALLVITPLLMKQGGLAN
jgi:hypothetical protein